MSVTISGTSGISQNGVGTAPIQSYTGTAAMPTASSQTGTFTHGLGSTPRLVRLVAVCVTASQGYSVGDEIELLINGVSNGNYQYFMCWASSTQVGWMSGSALNIPAKSSSYLDFSLYSNTNFNLKVYAFA